MKTTKLNSSMYQTMLRNYKYLFFIALIIGKTRSQDTIPVTSIPMNLDSMVPNIEVKIDGKGPYRFEFDTGAGGSIISTKLANDLGLEVIGKAEVRSPANEESMKIDIVQVPEITISNLSITNLEMITMNFGEVLNGTLSIDGILSPKDFNDFLVTFNYPEKIIEFEKGSLNKELDNAIAYNTKMNNMNISVEIKVDGKNNNANLDTGFPGSFAFPISMQDALSFKNPPKEAGTAGMIGASIKIWKAQLVGDIHLGNIIFKSPEIILEDRLGDFITIGYSAFKDIAMTIDQKNALLRFERKTVINNHESDCVNEKNKYTGRYDGGRNITIEDGIMYLQRDGGMKLILELIENNLYEMKLPNGMVPMNKLPKILFDYNDNDKVIGLRFVHDNGNEEIVSKDK